MRHITCAILGVAVMSFAAECLAGVVLISRESRILASGQTSDDSFDRQEALTTVGTFNFTVGDSIDVPAGGTTRAEATQRSDVLIVGDAFSVDAGGGAEAQVAEFDAISASAESRMTLLFDVTGAPRTIRLNGFVAATWDATSRIVLDDGGSKVLFQRLSDIGDNDVHDINTTLWLSPGQYRLSMSSLANGTPTPNFANFSLVASFEPAAVIPLPPAVFGGMVMLAVGLMTHRGLGILPGRWRRPSALTD